MMGFERGGGKIGGKREIAGKWYSAPRSLKIEIAILGECDTQNQSSKVQEHGDEEE